MSSKLQGYVWDACAASGVKGTKLMVMVRLSDYSSDEGASYPGVKTIARQIGAGESTIRTAISELEADGWLTRENRRKGNRNTSNMYFLNVDKLEETALAERKAIKENRLKTIKSDPSDSDYSDFDASDSEYSTALDPSESGKNARFDPSESGGHDPQDLKHDPQVKDTEPQETRPKKKSFDPASAKPQNVSAEVWADWVKFRRERRSALTETTCQYQAKQLAGHGNADEVIRRSIASGWQGLFPERVPSSQADSEKAQPRPYAYHDTDSSEVFLNLDAMRSDSGGNRRF